MKLCPMGPLFFNSVAPRFEHGPRVRALAEPALRIEFRDHGEHAHQVAGAEPK